MADIGLALTWIAISAASAKGLSAFARTVATNDSDAEPARPAAGSKTGHEARGQVDGQLHLLHGRA